MEVQDLARQMVFRLESANQLLVSTTIDETGFTGSDSKDLIDGTLAVARYFSTFVPEPRIQKSKATDSIVISNQNYGEVSIVLPRNAAPYLATLCALSALSSGNKVQLKFPSACTKSAEIMEGIFDGQVEISQANGPDFVRESLSNPNVGLIHFIGDSIAGASYLQDAFMAGKNLVIDGNGNCIVYVSEHIQIDSILKQLLNSAMRFNGQTCTSLNGIIVHPKVSNQFKEKLSNLLHSIKFGDPHNPQNEVGYLFSEKSVEYHEDLTVTAGGTRISPGESSERLFCPTLILEPTAGCQFECEGAFAPLFWIREGEFDEFIATWNRNQYPLCAGIFSTDQSEIEAAGNLRFLARLTVNKETSDEDPLEPWGAYGTSGNLRVVDWTSRYIRTLQVDRSI